jgi:acyl carrier protein
MTTTDQLTQLLHEKFDIEKNVLQPDLPLSEYGLDSLSLAELLFTIEDDFDIKFPDHPDNINTLRELVTLIDALRSPAKA